METDGNISSGGFRAPRKLFDKPPLTRQNATVKAGFQTKTPRKSVMPTKSKTLITVDGAEDLPFEEPQQTQEFDANISDEDINDDETEEEESDEDREGSFRAHANDIISNEGLETARAWFACEARKFKKPKLEKK